MLYCKEQIRSYNRSVYAESGDEVAIISLSGHVAIVQGKKGRFPVLVELLSDEPIEQSEIIKERKLPERKTPYTQAEKLQLEYLNSIR